jgi:nitrite reductase/ring-hydroxylating ferredoxin subunit
MIDAFLKVSGTGSRRDLFRSVGLVALGGGSAAVLAACSGAGSGSGGSGGGDSGSGGSGGPLTIAKADVPDGSGVVKDGFIVTQPTSGNFKAFSNKCTHMGCPISEIKGSTIMCNCHGSEFSVKDGSVLRGPAQRPLNTAKITPDGSKLKVSA